MATSSITLPSGATVNLNDPDQVKQKDRAKVYLAMDGLPMGSSARGMAGTAAIVGLMVESWTVAGEGGVPAPIPGVDPGVIGELSLEDYDALDDAADAFRARLFPDLSPSPSKPGVEASTPTTTSDD